MTAEQNKLLVRRLVEDAVNCRCLEVLDELAEGEFALVARRWIGPFRESFPDFKMEIVDLVANGEKVAAHFRCSGTHLGAWMGHPPTGRRFQDVDEIYIFQVRDGKLAAAFGVEDNPARMRQLGLSSRTVAPATASKGNRPLPATEHLPARRNNGGYDASSYRKLNV
jgi:predicted ester cyclase